MTTATSTPVKEFLRRIGSKGGRNHAAPDENVSIQKLPMQDGEAYSTKNSKITFDYTKLHGMLAA
jgi:hypothetical protein